MASFDFDRIKHRWIIDEVLHETKSGIYRLELMSSGLTYYVGRFSSGAWDYKNHRLFNYSIADRITKFLVERNGQNSVPNTEKILVPRGHIWNFAETLRLIEIGEMYWAEKPTPYTDGVPVPNEFLTHWQREKYHDTSNGITRNDGKVNWMKMLNEFRELCNVNGGIHATLVEKVSGSDMNEREKYWINYYNEKLIEATGNKISNYEYVLDESGVENRQPNRELDIKCREELYDILRHYKEFKDIQSPPLYKSKWGDN